MQPDIPTLADDTTIGDDAKLWRRIHKIFWEPQGNGEWRVSSGAFDNASDGSGMSVHLADVAAHEGVAMEDLLPDPKAEFGMVVLTAGAVRANRQIVVREPEPQDPTHAEVVGAKPTKVRKRLRDASQVLRQPPAL